ncbi:hypothetical protein CUJ83_06000 [Methanocella sp. CWC-04]|uniref:Uncharacterized protein n=1 Tax=Methanooceanicella nereidis TaxID=2052831 RepID=A0AAP2W5Q1_9EURY|nr:hypothetical protein [Methanocella sp. CWC-04]MCD1294553.1 hypothetical protein [Methanocella sp. CWC-04]
MERKQIIVYAGIAIVIIILLLMNISSYYALRSVNDELETYKDQQRQIAKLIISEYLPDMDAAERAWKSANPGEFMDLQYEGITVKADTIMTPDLSAVLDPADPYSISLDARPGMMDEDEVLIGLGKYYSENMTRVSGWINIYRINKTDHKVKGITSTTVQTIAYDHYVNNLHPNIHYDLGVSKDSIMGFASKTMDTSMIPGTDTWLDVTEYKYDLRNTGVSSYLQIKTYVNATDQTVKGVEVSRPYFESQAGMIGSI